MGGPAPCPGSLPLDHPKFRVLVVFNRCHTRKNGFVCFPFMVSFSFVSKDPTQLRNVIEFLQKPFF